MAPNHRVNTAPTGATTAGWLGLALGLAWLAYVQRSRHCTNHIGHPFPNDGLCIRHLFGKHILTSELFSASVLQGAGALAMTEEVFLFVGGLAAAVVAAMGANGGFALGADSSVGGNGCGGVATTTVFVVLCVAVVCVAWLCCGGTRGCSTAAVTTGAHSVGEKRSCVVVSCVKAGSTERIQNRKHGISNILYKCRTKNYVGGQKKSLYRTLFDWCLACVSLACIFFLSFNAFLDEARVFSSCSSCASVASFHNSLASFASSPSHTVLPNPRQPQCRPGHPTTPQTGVVQPSVHQRVARGV